MQVENKQGEMTIWGVCLSLVLIILFTPFFQFLNISREANSIQKKVQNDLNSFVTIITINSYDNFKNGVFDFSNIDTDSFVTHLGQTFELTYNETSKRWESEDSNFALSDIKLTVNQDKNLEIVVTYKLHLSTNLLGMKLINHELNKKAYSVLVNKIQE